jgi:hypothetical protein
VKRRVAIPLLLVVGALLFFFFQKPAPPAPAASEEPPREIARVKHSPPPSASTSLPSTPPQPSRAAVFEQPPAAAPRDITSAVSAGGIPFPPNLRHELAPEGFKDFSQRVIQTCGFPLEISAIDCTEYPCILWGLWDTSRLNRVEPAACPAWEDVLQRTTGVLLRPNPRGKGSYIALFGTPNYQGADRDLLRKRLRERIDGMLAGEAGESPTGR